MTTISHVLYLLCLWNILLAEANEPSKKRLKTIDEMEQPEDENNSNDGLEEKHDESSLYRHIRESEKGTSETVDAATQVIFPK